MATGAAGSDKGLGQTWGALDMSTSLSSQRCNWLKDGGWKSDELIGWRLCRGLPDFDDSCGLGMHVAAYDEREQFARG
jgi:hypothetical protein